MGPLSKYTLSRSIHDWQLFTVPADLAAQQVDEFAFSDVVGCLPLIYWENV